MTRDQRREEERNRLLRRVDWRFLLPRPRAARGVCFASGPLADAVALVVERVWRGDDVPADAQCDLAVAVEPDARTLGAAWRVLEPGGACYTEWRRAPWHTTAGIRRRLERAGFERVACYAPFPDPDAADPALWGSLDSAGSVRHFLAQTPRPRSRRERLRARLRRTLWRAVPSLTPVPTICAVARKPTRPAGDQPDSSRVGGSRDNGDTPRASSPSPPTSPVAFQDALREAVRDGWSRLALGEPPDRLEWTLLTGGRRSVNKVVALAFAGSDPRPRLVVKMARVPQSSAPLLNEAQSLEALQAPGAGVDGVPRLLFCRSLAGVLTVGETAISGRPLPEAVRREQGAEVAAQATDWLLRLVVEPRPRPLGERRHCILEPAVAEFEASFGSVVDPGMLREAIDAVEGLGALGGLPEVHEQRDFAPWNLLVTDAGRLAVLDWESSQLRGLPLLDLVYFLSYLAFYRERASDLAAYRRTYRSTLDPATAVGEISAACLRRYRERLGLSADAVRPLRLLTWMLHSRSEYRQFTEDAAGPPPREALRQSVFLALWEEELRRGYAS